MSALALWLLCLTDAGFAGFRDAAGRDPRIFKEELYRRAIRRGMGLGLGISALAALLVGAVLVAAPSPAHRFAELQVSAAGMLWVLIPYATLVLVAMGLWATAESDLRTLASVAALGPFTLVRPWVIVAAAIAGVYRAASLAAAGVAVAVCLLQLGVEPALGRIRTSSRA